MLYCRSSHLLYWHNTTCCPCSFSKMQEVLEHPFSKACALVQQCLAEDLQRVRDCNGSSGTSGSQPGSLHSQQRRLVLPVAASASIPAATTAAALCARTGSTGAGPSDVAGSRSGTLLCKAASTPLSATAPAAAEATGDRTGAGLLQPSTSNTGNNQSSSVPGQPQHSGAADPTTPPHMQPLGVASSGSGTISSSSCSGLPLWWLGRRGSGWDSRAGGGSISSSSSSGGMWPRRRLAPSCKELMYVFDGDKNGVIHYIATGEMLLQSWLWLSAVMVSGLLSRSCGLRQRPSWGVIIVGRACVQHRSWCTPACCTRLSCAFTPR